MRIKDRNLDEENKGEIILVPENLDDLWHLKYIIEEGDTVSALTERRLEGPQDKIRADSGKRETLDMDLRVEEVEFHRFSNRLRISGVIEDCGKERVIGEHHTINIEVHKEITVDKEWKSDQMKRLEEAEKTKDSVVMVVTVEEGEAYIHSVEEYGVEERGSFRASTGKGEDARPREELFGKILAALKRTECDAIILAGPGFTKNDVLDYIEENSDGIAEKIVTEDTASIGGRGVHEVLKKGTVEKIADEARVSRESRLIDELMEEISTDGKAAYGFEEVENAVEYGAVETLLVVDEVLRKNRDRVDPLITKTEQKGGEVTVFSSEFEPGQRLENLGGIGALLRYRM